MRRPRLTLRTRLTAIYATVFLLASGGLLAVTVVLVSDSLDQGYSAPGADAAKRLNEAIGSLLSSNAAPPTKTGAPPTTTGAPPTGKSGVPVESRTPPPTKTPEDTLSEAQQKALKRQNDLKQKLVDVNQNYGQAAKSDTLTRLVWMSLLTLGLLVPAAGIGGWLLAGRALRPVGAITEAARRASEHRLSDRLALTGPKDEVTELADTFDQMLDRLEHAFDAQRRFVANASHELRTPLTIARTAVEVGLAKPERSQEQLEEMAHDVHNALRRAEHLVDSLLTLTRSQHLAHQHEQVDLATAAEDALDAHRGRLGELGLHVGARLDPAPTTGNRALLDRLVSNLVDNAVRHNVPGGDIDVHTGQVGPQVFVTITNSGPVVPPERIPQLFEPFERADGRARSSQQGLGLGLSIVRAVADAHHADLRALARPEGGLSVTVEMAARPPALDPRAELSPNG